MKKRGRLNGETNDEGMRNGRREDRLATTCRTPARRRTVVRLPAAKRVELDFEGLDGSVGEVVSAGGEEDGERDGPVSLLEILVETIALGDEVLLCSW